MKISKVQQLEFELMKLSSFNRFDGEQVVTDLEKHLDLWKGSIIDSAFYEQAKYAGEYVGGVNLMKLRDIQRNIWNADTLFITPQPGKEDELIALANTWGADEIGWLSGKHSCRALGSWSMDKENNNKQVLRLWWD